MTEWIHVGKFSVESGTIQIGDPCYLREQLTAVKTLAFDDPEDCSGGQIDSLRLANNYPVAIQLTGGMGDGEYDVHVRKFGEMIAEVRVVFIFDASP